MKTCKKSDPLQSFQDTGCAVVITVFCFGDTTQAAVHKSQSGNNSNLGKNSSQLFSQYLSTAHSKLSRVSIFHSINNDHYQVLKAEFYILSQSQMSISTYNLLKTSSLDGHLFLLWVSSQSSLIYKDNSHQQIVRGGNSIGRNQNFVAQ